MRAGFRRDLGLLADQGLNIAGTMKGIYKVGSAIATGARAVAPMLALL